MHDFELKRKAPLATPTDLGGSTLRSVGHIARIQRVADNDAEYVQPLDMLAELREEHRDIATAGLIEVWLDETERRTWFLFEASRHGDPRR